MKLNNRKLVVSVVSGVLSMGVLFGGYSVLNKDVVLVHDGKETKVSTMKFNVEELLKSQNIKYDDNDIVSSKLDAKLKDGMKIEVVDVEEKIVKETESVPYDVEVIEDSNLDKGKSVISQEGKNGKNELQYKVIYHNDKAVSKEFVKEGISVEPINQVVKKGAKVELLVASSRGTNTRVKAASTSTPNNNTSSNNTSNSSKMTVVATAYSGDTETSTGVTPKWGTIAVDPSVIPYGTKVYIPKFNKTFIAQDTGSDIKGNRIDIFMNDESEVDNWGRQSIEIYIVK